MADKIKDKPIEWKKQDSENSGFNFLTLYNDDIHSFNYVIESLIEVCQHTSEQAEQCTMIAHFKGKCEVKKGMRKDIEPMQSALSKKGLITTID